MRVLVTGAYGRCGTALVEHLDGHELALFDRRDGSADVDVTGHDRLHGDIANFRAVERAVAGRDAVVHLAATAEPEARWGDLLEPNVVGARNVFEACRRRGVDTVVYASSLHAVGGYDDDHRPDVYDPDHPLELDEETPSRPDSLYAVTKSVGEDIGKYYAEYEEAPRHVYSLRIGSLNEADLDHPYGAAVRGDYERGTEEYQRRVKRSKAHWLSRRDFAHLVDCCLRDDTVEYDVFYGVSDNSRRWVDLSHARDRIGYRPRDSADDYEAPP